MILEICHPNDIWGHRWRAVEEFTDDVNDHLASPTFDVFDGLLARTPTDVWVYHQETWVDVSASSEFRRAHTAGTSLHLYSHLDYVSYWRVCDDTGALLASISSFVPTALWASAAIVCIRKTIEYTKNVNPSIVAVLDRIEENLADDQEVMRSGYFALTLVDEEFIPLNQRHIAQAIHDLSEALTTNSNFYYACRIMIELESSLIQGRHRSSVNFSNTLRQIISFYDIAVHIV